jgi:hypothetical protein
MLRILFRKARKYMAEKFQERKKGGKKICENEYLEMRPLIVIVLVAISISTVILPTFQIVHI